MHPTAHQINGPRTLTPDQSIDTSRPLHSGFTVHDLDRAGTLLLMDALAADLPIYDSWLVPDTHHTRCYASLLDALAAAETRWDDTHRLTWRIDGRSIVAIGYHRHPDLPWAHDLQLTLTPAN